MHFPTLARIKVMLSAIGLGVAAYLLVAEPSAGLSSASSIGFFCPGQGAGNGIINCSAVLASRYAYVLGVPLSAIAAAWLALSLILSIVQHLSKGIGLLSSVFDISGIFGVVYSAFIMLSAGHVCVYCSAIDAILLVLFAIGTIETRKFARSLQELQLQSKRRKGQ